MVLAVDDVADASDRESESDARRRRISTVADGQTASDANEESGQHATDRAAPDRDAAGPDEKDLKGIGEVVLPLIDDVNEPRADDAADDSPGRNSSGVLLRDARLDEPQGEPDTEEDANSGEDAMPCNGEWTEMNIGIERKSDHGALAPRRRRGSCPGSGSSLARNSPARPTSKSSLCIAGSTLARENPLAVSPAAPPR